MLRGGDCRSVGIVSYWLVLVYSDGDHRSACSPPLSPLWRGRMEKWGACSNDRGGDRKSGNHGNSRQLKDGFSGESAFVRMTDESYPCLFFVVAFVSNELTNNCRLATDGKIPHIQFFHANLH